MWPGNEAKPSPPWKQWLSWWPSRVIVDSDVDDDVHSQKFKQGFVQDEHLQKLK